MRTGNLGINRVNTKYVPEKGYDELLVLISMLFMHLFKYTGEYNNNTKVGLEPVFSDMCLSIPPYVHVSPFPSPLLKIW